MYHQVTTRRRQSTSSAVPQIFIKHHMTEVPQRTVFTVIIITIRNGVIKIAFLLQLTFDGCRHQKRQMKEKRDDEASFHLLLLLLWAADFFSFYQLTRDKACNGKMSQRTLGVLRKNCDRSFTIFLLLTLKDGVGVVASLPDKMCPDTDRTDPVVLFTHVIVQPVADKNVSSHCSLSSFSR